MSLSPLAGISAFLGFIAEPLVAAGSYLQGQEYVLESQASVKMVAYGGLSNYISDLQLGGLENKIKKFIKDTFQIDANQIILKKATVPMKERFRKCASPICAIGSLKYLKRCDLLFSKEYAEKLSRAGGLSNKDKYMIAHAVTHILNEDPVTGSLAMLRADGKCRLLAFAIAGVAMTTLGAWDLIPSYIVACVAGKISGLVYQQWLEYKQDKQTLVETIEKSAEITEGCWDYCDELSKGKSDRSKPIVRQWEVAKVPAFARFKWNT